jgi:hypothetical protein
VEDLTVMQLCAVGQHDSNLFRLNEYAASHAAFLKLLVLALLQMAVALGGRVAEELIFGEDDITTGASGDFQQVTRTARLMVTQLGFSKKLGQVREP